MPFVDEEIGRFVTIPEDAKELEAETPSVGETFGAAFRQENSFVSAASKGFELSPSFQPEEGYDPYDMNDIAGYETFAENFINSKSVAESAHIKRMIDGELEDRKTLEASGGTGFIAQMAAGITDPIYLPLMLTGFGSIKLGASATKAFGTAAGIGLVSELPAEAAKQSFQETRTLEESAINIGGATILSGLLGAGISKLSKSQFDDLAKKAEQIMSDSDDGPLSIGAAQVKQNTMDDLELVNVGKLEQWGVSPLIRAQTSAVRETRQIASQMMESPLITKGNVEGMVTMPEGGAVETRIKRHDAGLVEAIQDMDKLYLDYRQSKSATGRVINDYVLRNKAGKLSPTEFRNEIGKAMRNNDISDIPEVSNAAKAFREKVFNPLKDAAIDGGMLPRDVKVTTADSYLMRLYRTDKIIAKSDEFDEISRAWLNRIRSKAQAEMDIKVAKGGKPSQSMKGEAGITDLEIDEIVVSIRENITGVASGRTPYGVKVAERGPLKERVFNIPDSMIEDFLESDIDLIARQYTRTLAPDVELNRMFGTLNVDDITAGLEQGYEKLRKAATTEDQRIALAKKLKADKRDISAMWERLRGTYRTPEDPNNYAIRAGRVIRDVNFLRLLGGMTVSALPDLAGPVAINGLKPVSHAIKAMVFAPAKFKMARLEAKKAAIGLDMVLNSRASSLAELSDVYARGTKLERGLRESSDVFGKVTLMSQWNTAMKQFAGVVTQDRILEEAVKWSTGKISKNSIRRMASAGIDEDMAKRIAQQFDQYGDDGMIKLSNGQLWDDKEALDVLRSSMLKDVDRAILTVGEGEKPLWTSSETGKMIFQFKSFAAVAHHKILLANLQHRDLQALNGFLLSVALGSATYGLKQYSAGREISEDPSKLIVEALDRSGAFGYLWDVNNMIEKGTRGNFGVNSLLGAPPMSRYASRNITGALLGPSFGTANDMFSVVGGAASGEFTKSELRKLRKLLPAQNLFYMRRLLNELEDKAGRGLE